MEQDPDIGYPYITRPLAMKSWGGLPSTRLRKLRTIAVQ